MLAAFAFPMVGTLAEGNGDASRGGVMLVFVRLILPILMFGSLTFATTNDARAQSCVFWARQLTDLSLRGDAWQWWEAAGDRYQRSSQPSVGSVLVFRRTRGLRQGHVSTVSRVIDRRTIEVDHSWLTDNRLYRGMQVIDVSSPGDWSVVRVWHPGIRDFGSSAYPTYGFVHPSSPRQDLLKASVREVRPTPGERRGMKPEVDEERGERPGRRPVVASGDHSLELASYYEDRSLVGQPDFAPGTGSGIRPDAVAVPRRKPRLVPAPLLVAAPPRNPERNSLRHAGNAKPAPSGTTIAPDTFDREFPRRPHDLQGLETADGNDWDDPSPQTVALATNLVTEAKYREGRLLLAYLSLPDTVDTRDPLPATIVGGVPPLPSRRPEPAIPLPRPVVFKNDYPTLD